MAGRKKGHPKTGGRIAGQPNKVTADMRGILIEVLTENDAKSRLRAMMNGEQWEQEIFWRGSFRLIPSAIEAKIQAETEVVTRFYSSRPESERERISDKFKEEP